MTWEELKTELKSYLDDMTGEEPTERDIEILGFIEDFSTGEPGISEDEVNERISAAVAENDSKWTKKFKDRFYGRDEDAAEPEHVTEPKVVENEPEEEELKSILDYEW